MIHYKRLCTVVSSLLKVTKLF